MRCIICKNESFECIHKGTRDISDIYVLRCKKCGQVCLDNQNYNTAQNYMGGGMLKNTYSSIADHTEDMEWENWILETSQDDVRRYEALKDVCAGKRVLEFGCGNGGFLRKIKDISDDAAGVELMNEAREHLLEEGIAAYKSLDEVDGKYDIVCMFMAIEHLNHPNEILEKVYEILNNGGILICETPNSQDALISRYECKAFEAFTYWSEHVFLYCSDTLERLMKQNGFHTLHNTQIQRYSLANHLHWLSKQRPGGHRKWTEFNEKELNRLYEETLVRLEIADTLWYVGRKQ